MSEVPFWQWPLRHLRPMMTDSPPWTRFRSFMVTHANRSEHRRFLARVLVICVHFFHPRAWFSCWSFGKQLMIALGCNSGHQVVVKSEGSQRMSRCTLRVSLQKVLCAKVSLSAMIQITHLIPLPDSNFNLWKKFNTTSLFLKGRVMPSMKIWNYHSKFMYDFMDSNYTYLLPCGSDLSAAFFFFF